MANRVYTIYIKSGHKMANRVYTIYIKSGHMDVNGNLRCRENESVIQEKYTG